MLPPFFVFFFASLPSDGEAPLVELGFVARASIALLFSRPLAAPMPPPRGRDRRMAFPKAHVRSLETEREREVSGRGARRERRRASSPRLLFFLVGFALVESLPPLDVSLSASFSTF